MGASFVWGQKTKTVYIQYEEGMISLQLGAIATINGEVVMLDVLSTMVNYRVLVPLRFVSQSLGASVKWLPYYQAVMINSN